MSEHEEEPARQRHKIDITVAGHTVIVDSDGDLKEVEEAAKRLFHWSAQYASRSAVGFASPPPQAELAPPEDR